MLDWLNRKQWLVAAASLALLLVVLAVGELLDQEPPPLEFRQGSALPPGAPIRVHVTGAVVSPGVYAMREGDRVVDLVEAAGGPAEGADLGALNLARRLRDEERVVVPEAGRQTAAIAPGPGGRLDINTASARQLELLPGIGEAYSRRIVDSRQVDGPYASTEDLVQRRVLPRATFERIRDMITVGDR